MEAEFWHERWKLGEIGFHEQEVNRHLVEFAHRLEAPPGSALLVPLCGKSRDMAWLARKGYRVTGIELSEVAARDFFQENDLDCTATRIGGAPAYFGGGITIICADFFAADFSELAPADAVYDRASLVALPPEMRPAYAARLTGLIAPATRILLVTLDYPQDEMRGPPFAVPAAEVETLFTASCEMESLRSEDILALEPRFRKKGLTRLEEQVFILSKRA